MCSSFPLFNGVYFNVFWSRNLFILQQIITQLSDILNNACYTELYKALQTNGLNLFFSSRNFNCIFMKENISYIFLTSTTNANILFI